ncbi:MAG: Uncharacterized protein G01um101416_651 [Microgenomates group bacterium Gr01-1014_16]|nr:MAG: Uncharacterized protein G01um101416_651 [Microgenomates group bacterium Gr01-1014_16]
MIKPRALKVGDTVGVVAPSDAVEREGLERSAEVIKKWGLKVKWGKHVFAKVGDFMAGTAEERIEDLKTMIFDPDVKVIWAAAGGYAATEILPAFNKDTIAHLRQNPKWFIGYSDVCLILNILASFKMTALMGPSLWGLSDWDRESRETIRKMLFGEQVTGIDERSKWKKAIVGEAEGRMLGEDLELLILSFGTRFDPIAYGEGDIILALEELDIEKSTLQRQIDIVFSHKRANRIKGMIVGRLVNIKELSYPEWGKKLSPQELIVRRVKKFGIPLAFCEDFGHAEWDYPPFADIKKYFYNRKFLTIPNGIRAKLTVGDKCKLEYLEDICDK